jgi:hypothetical protein
MKDVHDNLSGLSAATMTSRRKDYEEEAEDLLGEIEKIRTELMCYFLLTCGTWLAVIWLVITKVMPDA